MSERDSALPADRDRAAAEGELVSSRADGPDVAAFAELYRSHLPGVYRYMRMRAPTEEEAADLTQQVFLKALDALPRYSYRGLPFSAWLYRIARNVATDAYRRRRDTVSWELLPEALHPPEPRDVEADMLRRERLGRLRLLLDELDTDRRDLVTLHFVGGLTQREIGLILGKSQAKVQRELTRTLRILRERFDEG